MDRRLAELVKLVFRLLSGYGGFRKMAERVRGRCASCWASPPVPVCEVGAVARRWTGNVPRPPRVDHGPLHRRSIMDLPISPPLAAGPAALPYMGIKRTAPRDWSIPGTSRRPRPNAFQTANGISSRRRRRHLAETLPLRAGGPPTGNVSTRRRYGDVSV